MILIVDPHPRLKLDNRRFLLDIEIEQFSLTGNIQLPIIEMFYNIFSWIHIDNKFNLNKIKNSAVRQILAKYDLSIYKGPTISYSAVFLYAKLSQSYNMKALLNEKVVNIKEKSNKLFDRDYFIFDELYEMYNNSKMDLSKDFLLFNTIFREDTTKVIESIKSYGDVVRTTSKTNLIRPDFSYKLATRQLQVNYNDDDNLDSDDKTIYVLQDCTYSMRDYKENLNAVKAFILNEAFKHDYIVEWIFIESFQVDSQRLSKENIKHTKLKHIVSGSKVNITNILTEDRFLSKQVIIITDGTDSFDFKFNTKTKKINVISFKNNINIKNKIANYGKFFKT